MLRRPDTSAAEAAPPERHRMGGRGNEPTPPHTARPARPIRASRMRTGDRTSAAVPNRAPVKHPRNPVAGPEASGNFRWARRAPPHGTREAPVAEALNLGAFVRGAGQDQAPPEALSAPTGQGPGSPSFRRAMNSLANRRTRSLPRGRRHPLLRHGDGQHTGDAADGLGPKYRASRGPNSTRVSKKARAFRTPGLDQPPERLRRVPVSRQRERSECSGSGRPRVCLVEDSTLVHGYSIPSGPQRRRTSRSPPQGLHWEADAVSTNRSELTRAESENTKMPPE